MQDEKIELSIVSTVYNDAPVVPQLVKELTAQALMLGVTYEIILVNDSSPDNSEDEIRKACAADEHVKGISLARNYGQQIAVSAGVRSASGKYVIVIDGDLENPISAIPDLYRKVLEGFDLVLTVSDVRQTFFKRFTSRMFWFVVCRLLRIDIIENQLLLRIMSRRMVDHYNSYGEISRSVAGINMDVGLKTARIEVKPNKRVSGRSNYNFYKRLNVFIDVVLNLSSKPLTFVIFLGFITFLCSIAISIYYIYMYAKQGSVPGYTSTIISNLYFGSIIIFTLGIMSRYLSLIYLEVRNRPLFIVKEKFNL
jgi:polyisoprenyl-phosphate glycosyltransferase